MQCSSSHGCRQEGGALAMAKHNLLDNVAVERRTDHRASFTKIQVWVREHPSFPNPSPRQGGRLFLLLLCCGGTEVLNSLACLCALKTRVLPTVSCSQTFWWRSEWGVNFKKSIKRCTTYKVCRNKYYIYTPPSVVTAHMLQNPKPFLFKGPLLIQDAKPSPQMTGWMFGNVWKRLDQDFREYHSTLPTGFFRQAPECSIRTIQYKG